MGIIVTLIVIFCIILFLAGRGFGKTAADGVIVTQKVAKATPVVAAKGAAVTTHVVGTGVAKGAHLTAVGAQKGAAGVAVGAKVTKATAVQTKKVIGRGLLSFKQEYQAEMAKHKEEDVVEVIETPNRARRVQASQQTA